MLPSLLPQVGEFVRARLGLHFPPERFADLERGLNAAAVEGGFAETDDCARWLLFAPRTDAEVASLASHLTVGETYFFRDPSAFDALEQQIIPELLTKHARPLRIWSAACCTGEEAYSLAICAHRAAGGSMPPRAQILATDINPRFLEKAAEGIYSGWSFRGVPEEVRTRYFAPVSEGKWQVSPAIREMVTFAAANLFAPSPPLELHPLGPLDVVFCRNVLMYFAPADGRRVVANIFDALQDGGWLFASAAEASHDLFGDFVRISLPGAHVFQKPAREVPSLALTPRDIPAPARPETTGAPEAEKHYLRGLILQEQGALEEAEASLRLAVDLTPDFVLAHFALGNVLLRAARSPAASGSFERARALLAQLDPDAALPHGDGLTAARLLAIIKARQEADP